MDEHTSLRKQLRKSKRLVIKIGSQALASHDDMFDRLAAQIAAIRTVGARQRRIVLVSSGAIALGMGQLGMKKRPRSMAGLQAAAAAGQGVLMHRYAKAFEIRKLQVAQVLLTHSDLASRTRANNARAAITKLLDLGVVPIINENDAVAVDEIRFGDNDELAAMVAPLCGADLLLLLSNVEGLLAGKERLSFVKDINEKVEALAHSSRSATGRGGMQSKLKAVRQATLAGTHVAIAKAEKKRVIQDLLQGKDVGTLFPGRVQRLSMRKHWIAYTLRPRGGAVVDDQAARALLERGQSIACKHVLGVRGEFLGGDPIRIFTTQGDEIARGLAQQSAAESARLAQGPSGALVDAKDLVVLPR
jgi:glutamate 5-kinase